MHPSESDRSAGDPVIEVRSAYVVKAGNIHDAIDLWKEGRRRVWPQLGWDGRLQQLLHGHCQQSLLVWSSLWPSLAAWEEGMARTRDLDDYKAWSRELNALRWQGAEREVFRSFGRTEPLDSTPGKVEVRSAYLVALQDVRRVEAMMLDAQERLWPVLEWSGMNQRMLHGKASQSFVVWTSTWQDMGDWESGMARTRGNETFKSWYRSFLKAVDIGATREVFRNF